MNYGKNEVEKTLRKTNSRSQKITSHLVLLLTKIILILVLFAAVLGISFGYGIFKGVIDARGTALCGSSKTGHNDLHESCKAGGRTQQ